MWKEKFGGETGNVATGRTWTSYEWSNGAWHAREHKPSEYWWIFVFCGWGEEETWVIPFFAACLWVYTKCVLCDGQETRQNFLKRRMLSVMESVNWIFEEVLEEHE